MRWRRTAGRHATFQGLLATPHAETPALRPGASDAVSRAERVGDSEGVESGENEVWLSSRMQGQQGCAQASVTVTLCVHQGRSFALVNIAVGNLLLNTRKRAAHLFPEDHAHAGSSASDAIRHPFAHGWEIRLGEVKSLVAHEVAGVQADKYTTVETVRLTGEPLEPHQLRV